MVRLYIVRHAIAVPPGTRGIPEDERPLTDDGVRKMKEAAEGLGRLKARPALILSSPLRRARQTAEILQDVLASRTALEVTDSLAPAGKRSGLYAEILARASLDSLMIVGHQPSLGQIAGEIVWGSADCFVEFKKGGACAIDLEQEGPPPRGSLLWLMTPSALRKLAG